MDALETTQRCLARWDNGGSGDCHNVLTGPHSNPHDPDCNAVLITVYHTLISSTLLSWTPKNPLSLDAFVTFVRSVVDHLPSSSTSADKNPSIVAFGEIFVDIIWTIDSELEEILGDAKTTADAAEQGALSTTAVAQAVKAKGNAEKDKEIIKVLVRRFLSLGVLDPAICRERLDLGLVASVGLVGDKTAFERKEIRMRTGLFYKQNKFNLLREQSEGYSKLTTELTSNLGPAHLPSTGYPAEPIETIEARARPTWERALGLIGYFDLDPNRVLDIILDVFSVHLVTHHRFFLALLSFSPWGCRRPRDVKQEDMTVELDPAKYRGKSLTEVLRIAEEQSGAHPLDLDISKMRVLAQVLGFKFTYYQSPDVTETTPHNLYLLAAILIREGFLSLEDLYPHILPFDDEMGDLHKAYLAKVDSRIAGAKISQLAMAAPLESGSATTKARSTVVEQSKEEVKEAPNQKLGLLTALLSVGALRPAIAILSKFPWMVDAYPELADLMIRVLKFSMAPLYDSTVPSRDKTASFTKPRARFGATGVVPAPERRPQLTLIAPTPPSTSVIEFVFFFPDWVQRVPTCQSFDDLVNVLEPLMRFVGLHVSRDTLFLTKFMRLGRQHMTSTVPVDPESRKPTGTPDPTNPIRLFWFKVSRLYLLPALPLIRGNAVCIVDVWNILRQFETTLRWQLYGEWKASTYKSHPELRVRQVQADREAKGIMRRLSHNTIDTLSGTVAKLAHSNPCIFFTNAVNQIMAYDNLAGVVIQALNYVTIMGFDVLVYVILEALANPNKERVKDDGVNISDWLQSLASFTGMLFRRYSADITPLLKYIVHQLHTGQTTEIIVLRELIWKMAGIEPLPSLSDGQVAAMAGGPTLRIEAVASATRGARLDPGDANYRGPLRLGRSLLDSSLALPLLVQVAQQRQSCVFQAPDAHLKSLASLFDATHGVLLQYLELLTTPSVITAEDYAKKVVPPLGELNEKYGIAAPICMQIYRPILNGTLLTAALEMQKQERVASEQAEKRLKAALTAKREPIISASRVASPNPGAGNATNGDVAGDPKPAVAESQSGDVVMDSAEEKPATPLENPWLPELFSLFEDVKKIAPGNAAEIIGPAFYLTFWQLSTYDLSPPAAKYDEECSSLRALSRNEDSKYTTADRSTDRAKRMTAMIHRDKRNRINTVVNALMEELKEQTAARAFTIKRLAREKQHWFAHNPKAAQLAVAIIEYCIQPRCLISPMDADFCAQIIKVIHLQGTPGFSTLVCYDKLLAEHVKVIVFSCSEYEARNYGRFLLGILTDIMKWYQDEQLFLQENRTKSGGNTAFLPGLQLRFSSKPVVTQEDLITWHDWKQVVRKWHRKIGKCFVETIEAGDFMHVYNAIVVLKEILPVFPVASVHEFSGATLNRTIEKFLEKEERGDLKILGRAYHASLKKREPIWAPKTPGVPKPIPNSHLERPRTATPTAPTPQTDSRRAPAPSSSSMPSAPKSQLVTAANSHVPSPAPPERNGTPNALRFGPEGVPRPEVIKRVRPEKPTENAEPAVNGRSNEAMDVDPPFMHSALRDNLVVPVPAKASPIPSLLNDAARSPRSSTPTRSSAVRSIPNSPRGALASLDPRTGRSEPQVMPPPSEPSQTLSAQELRETAKQTRAVTTPGEKEVPMSTEPRAPSAAGAAPSPRRRSPSPGSRPGTRNPSSDSRGSGDRRSARGSAGDKPEDRRSERDSRPDTSRRERNDRRAAREDKDGDRDRPRDRHGDRERRDRERDRDKDRDRERDRDREPHRDRERERDRDRDRDRHRREGGERDREGRKERDGSGRGASAALPPTSAPPEDRGLPSRPETGSRHRNAEDSLGKRRRGGDDETDRSSKRSSRKDSHHEERPRRLSNKDGHDRSERDPDRRRKEREQGDTDGKGLSIDTKVGDKRLPEGPPSAKGPPPSTPSAPRAMTSGDGTRKSDRERDWKRDQPPPVSAPNGGLQDSSQGGSLRSRISTDRDRDGPRSMPATPSTPLGERRQDGARDDERDSSRKRTLSDRERDGPDSTGSEPTATAPKRPRINRNRYESGGLAKKLLPIDPLAADKARAARKDQ